MRELPTAEDAPADRLVLLCIVLLLLSGDVLMPVSATRGLLDWLSMPGLAAPTAVIAGLVGFAELVSRYRDAPWRVAMMAPGLVFIGVNASAGIFALFLMETFPDYLHTPLHPVMKVILAGTGAMVAVRTKLFTLRQPSGSDIAVGPAFILDTMLSAINREVDRRRAQKRMRIVAKQAAELGKFTYAGAMDFLTASLAAFQNLDADTSKKLDSDLRDLSTNTKFKDLDDRVKFLIAGYSILTEFGDRAFQVVFSSLAEYLTTHGTLVAARSAADRAARA